jgi:Tfp pilus assembly protein PilX
MPRKKEASVVTVLDYFETAPLEAAKLALQLASRAIRKREEPTKKKDKPQGASGAAGTATTQTPPAATEGKSTGAAGKRRETQAPPVGQPPAAAAPEIQAPPVTVPAV